MLAADTNVRARAYLNDEPAQACKACSALAEARSAGEVFVPLLVLAELSRVLRGRWDRGRVLDTIAGLLQTRGVTVEWAAVAWKALEVSRKGAAGFAEHLIAEIPFASGAQGVITFDKAPGRVLGVRRLKQAPCGIEQNSQAGGWRFDITLPQGGASIHQIADPHWRSHLAETPGAMRSMNHSLWPDRLD